MTDLRFLEELEMLLAHDALIIYIARPEAEDSLQRKKAAGDAMALNSSERFYDVIKENPSTVIIPNAQQIYHLHNAVRTAVKNKFGHPLHWERDTTIHLNRMEGADSDAQD